MRDLGDSNAGRRARRPQRSAARDMSGRRGAARDQAAREQAAPGPAGRDQQAGGRSARHAGRHSGGSAPSGPPPSGGPGSGGPASGGPARGGYASGGNGSAGGYAPSGGFRSPGDPGSAGSGGGWRAATPANTAVGKGPIRGFPPAPGQPPPFYPPGQFAAWNAPGARPAPRQADRSWYGGSNPGGQAYDPGYSALAVSDPAADVTSTQTWEKIPAIGDGGSWTSPRGTAVPAAGPTGAAAGPGMAAPGSAAPGAGRPGRPGPDGTQALAAGRGTATPGTGPGGAAPGGTAPGGPSRTIAGPAGAGPAMATAAGSRSRTARAAGSPAGGAPANGARAAGAAAGGRGGAAGAARAHSAAGRAGARPAGRPARKSRRSPSVMLAVSAVLALAVAAGGFLFFTARNQNPPVAASPPPSTAPSSSAAASPSPSLGPFGHIATRKADPRPLTITQLYPATFSTAGIAFKRTISRAGKTCSSALVGSALQSAVKSAKCTQVVRASYLAAAKKEMGTIGVLNLSTSKAAGHAGRAAGASDFIEQLKAKKGATHTLGKGTGIEEAVTKGHYLILIWAQFTSHSKPATKGQRKELANFMNYLFRKTANVSLSSRMVTGSP
ncbi:MAG TPA: hypothetical protein VFV41_05905 [Streptosporangiaceae bacterium]|nr:hypothetical protein [Streptosporangiaceae bacterium]